MALSIALTAVTSVVAMLSLPLLVNAAMQFFMNQSNPVDLPLAPMVRSIFMLTTVPVLIGVGLRAWHALRLFMPAISVNSGSKRCSMQGPWPQQFQ